MPAAALLAMPARDPHEHHRVSSTLELFFDLVSVIAIAAVTAGLHHAISEGHGAEALPRFAFLFLAVWWAWMNLTWFASAFDSDDTPYRLLVMVIICGELIFAGGADHIFATLDFGFGLIGWIVMRLGMIGLWLRAALGNPGYRTTALRYAGGIFLAQICWTAMYFATDPGSTAFFVAGGLCFLVEWSVPLIAETARPTPFHRHHIIERYGLLMIISLGEIVLSVAHGFGSLFGHDAGAGAAVVSVAALVIVFAVWWVYFCEREHLVSARFAVAFVWGYGHVLVFMATAALGAAVAASVDVAIGEAHTTQPAVSRYLGGSLALLSLMLWIVRDRFLPLPAMRRPALAAMAAVFAAAALAGAPVWVFALLAVAMTLWRVPQPGRPGESLPDAA